MTQPGLIVLLGSGETSPNGGHVFETLARTLPKPLVISVLETPAGFELNASQVAGRVANFIKVRLQNYHPQIHQIPARKRGSPESPDNPAILAPLLNSSLIFLGPGSPTYTVRQLSGSLAWEMMRARHRLGAVLVLASAASIAIGAQSLPVYEIYKVGEDPHWKPGLDFFAPFGLSLVIVSHWNNNDGGHDVDTNHCFIGRSRFEDLFAQLDPTITVIGLDEHTGLIIDLSAGTAQAIGQNGIHILRHGLEHTYHDGQSFPLDELGPYIPLADPQAGIRPEVWQEMAALLAVPDIPPGILLLVERRQKARIAHQWNEADNLRIEIQKLGWCVVDTPQGPLIQAGPCD